MSPLKVLGRGYAMARDSSGGVLRTWRDTAAGEAVLVTLGEGGFTCTVEATYEKENGAWPGKK